MDSINNTLMPHINDTLMPHINDTLMPHINDTLMPHINDTLMPHINDTLMPHINDTLMPHINDTLMPELIQMILSFLPETYKTIASFTCKKWRGLVGERKLNSDDVAFLIYSGDDRHVKPDAEFPSELRRRISRIVQFNGHEGLISKYIRRSVVDFTYIASKMRTHFGIRKEY